MSDSAESAAEKLAYSGKTPSVRLGWVVAGDVTVEGPVGFRKGYGYRSLQGQKVHACVREEYGAPYGEGDVIGMHIHFENRAEETEGGGNGEPPASSSAAGGITGDGAKVAAAVRPQAGLTRSAPKKTQGPAHIEFFKNGVSQGIAYTFSPATSTARMPSTSSSSSSSGASSSSVSSSSSSSSSSNTPSADAERRRLEETKKFMAALSSTTAFYPAVSMFGRAKVRFNAGPDFAFGMPAGARPMSDRAN